MRIRNALSVVVATAAILGVAGPAMASVEHNGKCEGGELCLYYNSNLGGSMHDFNNPVGNFANYKFISQGSGAKNKGAGQSVKNNAASARNMATVCNARVYFNSNQQGVYDEIKDETWANLSKTYNENASFDWPGAFC